MIASVMTTKRAGRPIDFHIPTRLKSIGGTSSGSLPEFLFEAIKGGRTYTGEHSLSTQPAGAWPRRVPQSANGSLHPVGRSAACLTARTTSGNLPAHA